MNTYLSAFICPHLQSTHRGWWQMRLNYKRVEKNPIPLLHFTHYENTVCTHVHVFKNQEMLLTAGHYFINCQPVSPSFELTNSGSLSSIFLCWTCVVCCSKTSCVLNPCTGLAYTISEWGIKGANFNLFFGNLDFLFIGLLVAVPSFTLTLLQ